MCLTNTLGIINSLDHTQHREQIRIFYDNMYTILRHKSNKIIWNGEQRKLESLGTVSSVRSLKSPLQ